jgi:hypothetical protein
LNPDLLEFVDHPLDGVVHGAFFQRGIAVLEGQAQAKGGVALGQVFAGVQVK